MASVVKIVVKRGMEARFKAALPQLDVGSSIIDFIPPRSFIVNTKIKKCDLDKITSVESTDVLASDDSQPLTVARIKKFTFGDLKYNGHETMVLREDDNDSYIGIKLKEDHIMIIPSNAIIISSSDLITMLIGLDNFALIKMGGVPIKSISREEDCYILT